MNIQQGAIRILWKMCPFGIYQYELAGITNRTNVQCERVWFLIQTKSAWIPYGPREYQISYPCCSTSFLITKFLKRPDIGRDQLQNNFILYKTKYPQRIRSNQLRCLQKVSVTKSFHLSGRLDLLSIFFPWASKNYQGDEPCIRKLSKHRPFREKRRARGQLHLLWERFVLNQSTGYISCFSTFSQPPADK